MKTIEVGIDLGTTNSAVAVVKNGEVEIIKSASGEDTTPSIVFADKSGKLLIGSKAKKKTLDDNSLNSAQNWRAEIKRLMGTNETIIFPNIQGALSPEIISAEILKSLLVDVERRMPNISRSAAVITVPAHFSTLQSEATKRAGQLAGIETVVLLQEPIAAAIAYGFSSKSDENWLVYDLGGGTFDVALVAARGGSLAVLAHAGDNFLGGKDIDAAVVDNFLGPYFDSKGYSIDYKGDAALNQRLRAYAEQGKIDLSTSESTTIDVLLDWNGTRISETFEFNRTQLFEACRSLLQKTVDLCNETIKQSHIDPASIKRVVLVGGPTQMPVLRDFLTKTLKLPTDGSQDPLTVVARGAALFAQQIPIAPLSTKQSQQEQVITCELDIHYSPITSEDQQTLTGKIRSASDDARPHTICFQAEDKSFDSGDIILKNGKFVFQLPTGKRGTRYWIYVKSQTGDLITSEPDSIAVSKGVSISGSPLPHSVGVSILSLSASKGFTEIDETMDIFFERNSILPVSATKRFYTVTDVAASDEQNALPIRIYEGESPIPNRNSLICDLAITGKMVTKNLRKASAVDISISIDESRQLTVKAYLPEVDLTLNARATIYDEDISVPKLKKDLTEQSSRGQQVAARETSSKEKISHMISDIETTLSKSANDSDQRRKASKQIRDLMVALDETEAMADFDRNVVAFLNLIEKVQNYISGANPVEKRPEYGSTLTTLKQEGTRSVEAKDPIILKQVIEKIGRLHWFWMLNDQAMLAGYVDGAKKDSASFKDQGQFQTLIKACDQAIQTNNTEELRNGVLQLIELANANGGKSAPLQKAGITKL